MNQDSLASKKFIVTKDSILYEVFMLSQVCYKPIWPLHAVLKRKLRSSRNPFEVPLILQSRSVRWTSKHHTCRADSRSTSDWWFSRSHWPIFAWTNRRGVTPPSTMTLATFSKTFSPTIEPSILLLKLDNLTMAHPKLHLAWNHLDTMTTLTLPNTLLDNYSRPCMRNICQRHNCVEGQNLHFFDELAHTWQ